MLEPDQLRKIIDAAPVPLKAMILLGLNGGLGNTGLRRPAHVGREPGNGLA